MTSARSLREMSAEQLQFQLDEAQKVLFDLRCKAASEKWKLPVLFVEPDGRLLVLRRFCVCRNWQRSKFLSCRFADGVIDA